jgi:hypothetical protein
MHVVASTDVALGFIDGSATNTQNVDCGSFGFKRQKKKNSILKLPTKE